MKRKSLVSEFLFVCNQPIFCIVFGLHTFQTASTQLNSTKDLTRYILYLNNIFSINTASYTPVHKLFNIEMQGPKILKNETVF